MKMPFLRLSQLLSLAVTITFLLLACNKPSDTTNQNSNATQTASGGNSKNELTKVSVRFPIPIVESGQTTFYVAQDKGFYAAEGLDVSFGMGSRELNPIKTVATGQDMFAIVGGPDTLLVARSKGQPVKAIAVLHRNSNFPCLLTLKKSGITKVQQLEGKKVGFNYGHISTDVLRNLFRKANVKVTEVDSGFDYNQLITGGVDAEWAFTVTAGLDLPAKGVEVNVISPADYGIVTNGYTIFATDKTIAEKPDIVLKFLRASLRGVNYAVEHPEEANKSLIKRDPKLDEALNLKRQLAYNTVTSRADPYPAGYMDKEMFQTTYDRLVQEKVIEKPFNVTDAYTTRFLEEIYRRPFTK
ncbi:ABC transporter substrate-binding protein [bacterium]|nr:ABC transporter substrate-binding protein [bacterium]